MRPSHNLEPYHFLNNLKDLAVIKKIILFGSRARHDNLSRSDIDIAILCPDATEVDWLHILDIIDQADTLLKIDCVRLDQLKPQSPLKKNIEDEGVILYEKNSN